MPTKSKNRKPGKNIRNGATGRILGAKAFASITAVEGLKLNSAGKKRVAVSKSRKVSAAKRRAAVIRAYTTAKGC